MTSRLSSALGLAVLSDELGDQRPLAGRGFAVSPVRIHAGEGSTEFLLGPALLLIAQQAKGLADHLAGITEFAGADLPGDELLPIGRQGHVHGRRVGH